MFKYELVLDSGETVSVTLNEPDEMLNLLMYERNNNILEDDKGHFIVLSKVVKVIPKKGK